MLATMRSCGQAASNAASMRCPPVVNAPALPCRYITSSSGAQSRSSVLDSTLKCCASLSSTSGKMARATKMEGLLMAASISAEPDEGDQHEQRHQNTERQEHVAKKARHIHTAVFGNRLHHEVWCITNIGIGSHEHRSCRDGRQRGCHSGHQRGSITPRRVEKHQVGGGIVERSEERRVGKE